MNLSIGVGWVDFLIDHRQEICNSGHSDSDFDLRGLNHFFHFAQVEELSLDAPELAEPTQVVLFELLFEKIDFLECFLDFYVVSVAIDGVGEE